MPYHVFLGPRLGETTSTLGPFHSMEYAKKVARKAVLTAFLSGLPLVASVFGEMSGEVEFSLVTPDLASFAASFDHMSVLELHCQAEGCVGVLDLGREVFLKTSCVSSCPAFACDRCGRLHWPSGDPVSNRQEKAAFLVDGVIELR